MLKQKVLIIRRRYTFAMLFSSQLSESVDIDSTLIASMENMESLIILQAVEILSQLLAVRLETRIVNRLSRKKRIWVRNWIARRDFLGASNRLLNEFAGEDKHSYKHHLRMNEQCFNLLLNKIQLKIQKKDTQMRNALPAKLKLEVTLRFIASGDSYDSISYLYRVPKSTICKFIPEVLEEIYQALKGYLQMPSTNEWKIIENGFRNNWNFPNCFGAIDGKHIVLKAPPLCGSDYYNYKGTNSIILLALADDNYCFTYVDIGCHGRFSDGGVFQNSSLFLSLERGLLPENGLIVADDAFPLKTYLLKPYKGARLTDKEKIFNYRLSRARRIIENCFGILASRFRIFEKPIALSPDRVLPLVKACIVLHNWLRKTNVSYLQAGSVDIENTATGVVTDGEWRQRPVPEGLVPLPSLHTGNRSMISAQDVRNRYADYFTSRVGSVPWQVNYI